MITPFYGVDRNFDCTCLAKVTKAYPLPLIKDAVDKVMTTRRIIQLKFKPLTALELYDAILDGPEEITEKEYKKFQKWYSKLPLCKQRAQLIAIADLRREAEAKAKEKKKK